MRWYEVENTKKHARWATFGQPSACCLLLRRNWRASADVTLRTATKPFLSSTATAGPAASPHTPSIPKKPTAYGENYFGYLPEVRSNALLQLPSTSRTSSVR